MKTVHTDREPSNTVKTDIKTDANTFIENMKKTHPAKPPVIDIGPKVEPVNEKTDAKNSKAWLWVLLAIVVIAILAVLVAYAKRKKEEQNNGQSI